MEYDDDDGDDDDQRCVILFSWWSKWFPVVALLSGYCTSGEREEYN